MDQPNLGDRPFHLDLELFQFLLRELVKVKVPGALSFPKEGCRVDGADHRLSWSKTSLISRGSRKILVVRLTEDFFPSGIE